MEQSKALSKLLETADLLAMLEDLTNPNVAGRLSPASLAGLRLTIHSVRETILGSHDVLAATLVSKSRTASEPIAVNASEQNNQVVNENRAATIKRSDLRASLERIIER